MIWERFSGCAHQKKWCILGDGRIHLRKSQECDVTALIITNGCEGRNLCVKIRAKGIMRPPSVGYVDLAKIQRWKHWGQNSPQQSVFSGHKCIKCSWFYTFTTTDGHICICDRHVEGRCNDLFWRGYTGLDNGLRDRLVMNGEQYYGYGDSAYLHHVRQKYTLWAST